MKNMVSFSILYFVWDFQGYELVAEGKECDGSETFIGRVSGETKGYNQECANLCESISTMFIVGKGEKCNFDGCKCICETSADNGKCNKVDSSGYRLFRYDSKKYFFHFF